jgi:hypothetical protein
VVVDGVDHLGRERFIPLPREIAADVRVLNLGYEQPQLRSVR